MTYHVPELLVPVVRRMPGIGTVPTAFADSVGHAARGHGEVSDMAYGMGRGHKPTRNILLFNPDSKVLTVVVADGHVEMAELEDLAHEQIERNEERQKKNGRAFNFAEARERAGLPAVDTFQQRFQEAIEARIKLHRANPVTDPFRQPKYAPKENNPVTFFMGDSE